MKNVKSPEDALGFKVYLLRIYPYNKLFLYYIYIEEKLEQKLALFELKKNSKFLQDYLIHQKIPSADVIKI